MLCTPICDFVKQYGKSGVSRLHMPGHKGKKLLGCETLDITEIKGADSLYTAEGIIAQSEENARSLYESGKTVYSTEGSSQSIKAMLYLAQKYAPDGSGSYIFAGRNAHKAFIYGCALLDLDIEWMFGDTQKGASLCSCIIKADDVKKALESAECPPIAVYITAPDYLGYSPDIAALSKVCGKAGVPLLVDNAHGAYLKFLNPSLHPLDLGADICCDSAHKTLPALTGGAYLHLSKTWAEKVGADAKTAMEIFGSTSPSYLVLQSLDLCNKILSETFHADIAKWIERIDRAKARLSTAGWTVEKSDPLKITVNSADYGYSGEELAGHLRENLIECEFADVERVVFMLTPYNKETDLLKLEKAMLAMPKKEEYKRIAHRIPRAKKVFSPKQALFAQSEMLPVSQAVGRVCSSPSVSCPPAVPIAVSGEEISEEMVDVFSAYGIEKVSVIKKIP